MKASHAAFLAEHKQVAELHEKFQAQHEALMKRLRGAISAPDSRVKPKE
jgi:hypothetical protein